MMVPLTKVLSDNLKALMKRDGLRSAPEVYKKTGVSKAQVNNLLNETHAATLDTLEKLAKGFRVPPWALIHPAGNGLYTDSGAAELLDYYGLSTQNGRSVILNVAKGQASIRD